MQAGQIKSQFVSANASTHRSESDDINAEHSYRKERTYNTNLSIQIKQEQVSQQQDQPCNQSQLQINKKIFEKLPEANQLLPKMREPVEKAKLALCIPIMNLPSFNGAAPQREELHRSKSEDCIKQQYSISKGKSSLKKTGLKSKQKNSSQQSQLIFQNSSQDQINNKQDDIQKMQNNNNLRVKHISLHQQASDQDDNSKVNLKKRGFSNDQKESIKKISFKIQSSGNKLRENETNIQRYFLKLNVIYKKYTEIHYPAYNSPTNKVNTEESEKQKTEEDEDFSSKSKNKSKNKQKKEALYLSNVVQFNTVYCDLRRLIKSQNQSKLNISSNSTNQSIVNDRYIKVQTPLSGTNPVKKLLINQDNTSSQLQTSKNQDNASNPQIHELEPYYKKKNQADRTLIFESRFESGNLSIAAKISDEEYDLLLQNDINTHGHTQWFFFKVKNTFSGSRVKFNILNFCKSDSLFNQGMKVLVYSKIQAISQNKGWHRSGENISYYKNNFIRKQNCQPPTSTTTYFAETKGQSFQNKNFQKQQNYYSLSFTYLFENTEDEVYFAYNYPYTYSELQEYLDEQESIKSDILNRRVLCRTLAGNRIDLLTITSKSDQYKKQGIILSARVHPGETVSSFVMKGIIDNLLSDTEEAQSLRERFVFKIIPMLNPDGVVHGNYRCSLSGCDLNRRWKTPLKTLHPEIYHFKQMIYNFSNHIKLALFCDLHGHSMKKNIFIYGCHDKQQPLACRELPFLMSKLYEPFSFSDCNFMVQKSKEGTARVALWEGLRIPNIFTLESSFCGPSYDDIHFQQSDLEKMGARMCQAFLIYFRPQIKVETESDSYHQKTEIVKDKTLYSIPNRTSSESLYSPTSKTEQAYRGNNNKFDSIKSQQKSVNVQEAAITHSYTPTKQIRSISLDDRNMNNTQMHLEDLRKQYLNELWSKSVSEIEKLGMNESDESDSCPSDDNLDDKEISKIFDKTLNSYQKLTSQRKRNINNKGNKKQSFLNGSFMNNSQSQSTSPSNGLNNQSQIIMNEECSPFKKKEAGWNSYFGRGNSSLMQKKFSISEEKLQAQQKINKQSELSCENSNQNSQKKNIQQSQITLAAVKNKAFNFQCASPQVPTTRQSPLNRYDELASVSPKKILYYQQVNSRQLPSLQKTNCGTSAIENENWIDKRRIKNLKQQKSDDQQPFIANTLSKQIKYLQPNQQLQQQLIQNQQDFQQKQKLMNSQFIDNQQSEFYKVFQDKNSIVKPQYLNQNQQINQNPIPYNQIQTMNQQIQQYNHQRLSPYKRKYHKNQTGCNQKSNNNKFAQFDSSYLGNSYLVDMDKTDQNASNNYKNNLSNIEFRDENEDLNLFSNLQNQRNFLNQSMLPSLYTYESNETKHQFTEIQNDYLNADLSDQNSYQRANNLQHSISPKQGKNAQNNIISAVQNQIKRKTQKDFAVYIHQDKSQLQNQQTQFQNQSVEDSVISTMRYEQSKSTYFDPLKSSNQPSQIQLSKNHNIHYQEYVKFKNKNNPNVGNQNAFNQTLSQQSYYENQQAQKVDKQTLCTSSQDYNNNKLDSLLNIISDIPIKIKLNKSNYNGFNQITSQINQNSQFLNGDKITQQNIEEQYQNEYNNKLLSQKTHFSLGVPSISENQAQFSLKKKKKAVEQMMKKDLQNQIFNQRTITIINTQNNQPNQSSQKDILAQSSIVNSILDNNQVTLEQQTSLFEIQNNLQRKYDFQVQNNSMINLPDNTQQYNYSQDKTDKLAQLQNTISTNIQNYNSSKNIRSQSCTKQQKAAKFQNKQQQNNNEINAKKLIFYSINDQNLKQIV
ncbi:zinc carboxypeptidase family protein (macronuclear) [Tetrahymena thermophila SB210]|uniref:Zinc carboxypeptidase family protein n=1 Tax=Tetrahymena thermophila (strain SB210) TaxID=312017 RepID=I7M3M4_TETTS|nr:zinc carboxypeptidase family protein [Tetrahymena thermophila SB210]EAS03740.2 zinc carboxypeptidase family protein [Tetrahymena thermophila SB210]|eukprot:XP_001023985.2 zinc carboxypeptidase family protein [Tetrahymena thermophila SB210]